MNELKIFESEEFGKVRIAILNGEPWFCLKDICRALELANPSMVKTRLNEKGINTIDTLTKGGSQRLLYVNESNLYKTIFQSRKESAERFTDWVTSDVLPSIRKTGGYSIGDNDMTPGVKGSHTVIPMKGNWYDKVNPKIQLVCEVYGIDKKKLYHIILTNIQGVYSWDYAVMAYIRETGNAPRYPMDVVAHFQQFQEAAEQVMNILLERAGYGDLNA